MPVFGVCRYDLCEQKKQKSMARRFLTTIFILVSLFPVSVFSQEKKPTIMVLPSDSWCEQRYFMMEFNDQGTVIKVPDYRKAYLEDTEIGPVLSQIGQLLTDMGYSLKDSEQEIKRLAVVQAEDNVTISSDGSSFAESPLDILKRRTKSDIIVQVGWVVHKEHKGRSVSFILEAFDSYTNKRIATATGISKASNEIVPRILGSTVKRQIKPFDVQMMSFFKNLQENGREIVLSIKRWNSWGYNMESEFDGIELAEIIQDWLSKNSVKQQYNLSDASENFLQFEQVRIPLAIDGIAMDARSFTRKLAKFLKEPPFNIPSKVLTRGLGEAILVLGE